MSSWTILTLRAKPGTEYEHADYDEPDRAYALMDLVASLDADDLWAKKWTTWNGHVYVYLAAFGFGYAEVVLKGYHEMIDDAVVLEANNTADLGSARYYPDPTGHWEDQYVETQTDDGYYTGEVALAVMTARHGIIARDPFHNECGTLDDRYLEDGTTRPIDEQEIER